MSSASDTLQTRTRGAAGAAGFKCETHDRPVPAVRRPTSFAGAGTRLSCARRHGDRYGSVDGRAVLALANAPDFDPNRFWRYGEDERRDRAVMDASEPARPSKLVTAAAALESHKVGLTSRFPARDTLEVGGRTIHNAEDGFMAGTGSSETLEQIVEYSHNVGAAEVGLLIGSKTFYDMERKAGFGAPPRRRHMLGVNPGIVVPPNQWSGSSLATMAFLAKASR